MENHNASRLYEIQRKIDTAYEAYAKSIGQTYHSMWLLYKVNQYGSCTQKQLSEDMHLSKQTINSIVLTFQKDGLLELSEQAEDKRQKLVTLTKKGKEYAAEYFPRIAQTEYDAIAQFTSEEEKLFLDLYEKYLEVIIKGLMG